MVCKGKLCSIALASTALVIALMILVSAASSAQVTQIVSGSDPAIYGSKVVWTDEGVIRVYDLTAKTDTTIDSSAASNPAIYGSKLVWRDESSGTPRLTVYDTSTAAKSYITQDVDQYSKPAIYGNRIVWSANDSVYLRDVSTSTQEKIGDGRDPDIYDTKIVYYSYTEEPEKDMTIRMYDINTKEKITVTSSGDPNLPHIWGTKVIWSDVYNHMGYIAMYDISTKKITDITQPLGTDPDGNEYGASTGTHIAIQNDKIVYHKSADDYEGKPGVYVYNISTGQSTLISNYPEEIYTTPGVYDNTVVWGTYRYADGVTVYNGIYVANLSTTDTLPPIAEFTANVTSGTIPLVVLFTYTGTGGSPTSWLWEFGDGVNSKHAMDATHTFTSPGSYTISLTVENSKGNSTVIKKNYIITTDSDITYPGVPIANFSSNVTEGYAPLAVQFYDSSQNAKTRAWDFENDGKIDSSDPNPVYLYTAPGTYFVNLSVTNANGFSYEITTINVLEGSSSDDSNPSGGSTHSSGGSGGGGGSPEPARNVDAKELCQVFITNGKEAKFDFTNNATCVVYASFDPKKTLGKTTTIAEMLKEKSVLVSELPSGDVYKSFNIWVGNGGVATSKNIENSEICFKVEKSWVQEKDIDQASISLNAYSDKKWEQLSVSPSGEDEKFLYFTAETPGFSSFAITGKAKSIEGTETGANLGSEVRADETSTGSEGLESESGTVSKESVNAPDFEVVYGLAGLLAVFLYKRK